jgi:ketosteroid isomerase-like protein
VEIVRRAVAALNARDLEAYLACCREDVELHLPGVSGVHDGPQGIKQFLTDIEDAGPDFHLDLQDLQTIGGDQILAFLHAGATGRASGIPVGAETANVYDLVDGKISRVRIFLDRQQALKAVGLEE